MQQRKPRANQTHVVVQREPANAHVIGRDLHRFANSAHVGEQVCMRQHHAFGVARGAGGVLQQRDIAALARAASGNVHRQSAGRKGRSFIRRLHQFFRVYDSLKRMHTRPQQFGDGFRAAERQQHANFRIVQDCRLPRGVLFDAVGAKRRVNGDGNRSGEENASVREEERARSRQHQALLVPSGSVSHG